MLRVDGYIRVSRVGYRGGSRFISPTVQREQITGWASLHEAELLEVWEELDESGSRANRPLLESAIQRIERGVCDGIVVAKVDRFGRSLIDGLLTIQRIEAAGGEFFSVLDGLDLRTDTGRLVLRIMLSMAEWELDRVRTNWAAAKERAVRRGAYTAAFVPPGYRKTRAGRLKLDPRTAPIVAEAFRRRAAGDPMQEIARFLEANAVRTGKGNVGWSTTSTTRTLSMRAYLGTVQYGPHVNENAHPALIDPTTWYAAQRPRRLKAPTRHTRALLTGLLRCAACGMTMTAAHQIFGGREVNYFGCRRFFAMGACPEPAYIGDFRLDPCIESITFDLLARRRQPPAGQLRRAEERVTIAQDALARYRDSDRVMRTLGERAFADGLTARVERLRVAQLGLVAARDRMSTHALPSVQEIRARWPEMSVAEKRDVIEQVIDVIFVKRRGNLPLEERIIVCPAGTGPSGLPRQGTRQAKLRRYEPRRGWVMPTRSADGSVGRASSTKHSKAGG